MFRNGWRDPAEYSKVRCTILVVGFVAGVRGPPLTPVHSWEDAHREWKDACARARAQYTAKC